MTEGPRGAVARHAYWQGLPHDERQGVWCIQINQPGWGRGRGDQVEETEEHQPTVLARRTPEGKRQRRGACLGCDWEGQDRRRLNDAIEDAHDHSFPGWRGMPSVLPSPPYGDRQRWLENVAKAYPPGWFQRGGPIITMREESNGLHWAMRAPGGGYDMASPHQRPKKEVVSTAVQDSLLDQLR
ncbi:DUF6349 family protein [Nonomuraea sp. NPDC052116]|uniref:DUF6349 family protein n=1 Tax=Nonomuraea sp. NPDC052116 TaxID=3155665 RepID=UPI003441A9CB